MKIPEGYQRVTPYLIVKDAQAFLDFTKKLFKAEEKLKIMRDDKLIMHAEIKIGDSIIMFADSTDQFQPRNAGFFIYVENADETYKEALVMGAKSVTEPADQSYGRSAGIEDPFGNSWWVTSIV